MFAVKSVLVCAGLLLLSPAFASFDMLLQSDNDTVLGDHIDRYDPVSRVYLGSFNVFNGAPTSIAASSARGLAFVRSGSSNIDVFNYSTGEYVRTFFMAGSNLVLNSAQDRLFSVANGLVNSISLDTWVQSSTFVSGVTFSSALYVSTTGRYLIADDTSQNIRSFSPTGALISTVSYSGYSTVKQVALRANSGSSSVNQFRMTTGTTGVLYGFSEQVSSGALSNASTIISGYNGPTGVVDAHEGLWTVGTRTSAPTVMTVTRMNTAGFLGAPFALSQTSITTGTSAIVLAPEPGTVTALVLGAGALIRRRRKSA